MINRIISVGFSSVLLLLAAPAFACDSCTKTIDLSPDAFHCMRADLKAIEAQAQGGSVVDYVLRDPCPMLGEQFAQSDINKESSGINEPQRPANGVVRLSPRQVRCLPHVLDAHEETARAGRTEEVEFVIRCR